MKKRKGLTIKITLSNRWLYTLIVIGILIAVGISIYALTPGTKANPGHLLSEVSPPAPCTASQFLKWNGSDLKCDNVTVTNAFITYTTGYEYCQADCRKNGGPGAGCYNALASDGSQSSCVSGSADRKKCYCVAVGAQYPW